MQLHDIQQKNLVINLKKFLYLNYLDLAGRNNLESALLDSYADLIKDLFVKLKPSFLILIDRTNGEKVSYYIEFN